MLRLPEFISQEDLMDKPLVLLLVLASVLQTSITYSPGRARLVNQDVVALLAHGLPESLVLRAIDATDSEFDLSCDGLCNLRKAGISNEMIAAMLAAAIRNSR
jgi:hypothetical protein